MGDERCGVYPTLFYEAEDLLTIATIHATGLEGEVLAVHIGQRKNLRLVVKSHYGNDGIRTGSLPCEAEGVIGSGHLKYSVGSSMIAVL